MKRPKKDRAIATVRLKARAMVQIALTERAVMESRKVLNAMRVYRAEKK